MDNFRICSSMCAPLLLLLLLLLLGQPTTARDERDEKKQEVFNSGRSNPAVNMKRSPRMLGRGLILRQQRQPVRGGDQVNLFHLHLTRKLYEGTSRSSRSISLHQHTQGISQEMKQVSSSPAMDQLSSMPSTNVALSHPPDQQDDDQHTLDDMKDGTSAMAILNLCDHPPHQFSSTSEAQSSKLCRPEDQTAIKAYPFNMTETLCKFIYEKTGQRHEPSIEFYRVVSDTEQLYHVHFGKHVELCANLHKKFNKCIKNKFLTVCHNIRIVFINPHTCPGPSSETRFKSMVELLLENYFDGSIDCLDEICDGEFEMMIKEVGTLSVTLVGIPTDCELAVIPVEEHELNKIEYQLVNDQWPWCYPYHLVAWSDNPETHGLHGGWSYLPLKCMVGEVCLVVMVACVAVSGVVGNLLVVVVMLMGKHGGEESSRLRTSLAVADLISALSVVCPALYYHIRSFFTVPEYFSQEVEEEKEYILSVILTAGPALFQALLSSVCFIVSIQTIFLLSVERLIIANRPLKYIHYMSVPTVNKLIGLTWSTGILDTLLLAFSGWDSLISAQWITICKLPLAYSKIEISTLSFTLVMSHVVLLSLMCFITIACSVLAIVCFVCEQANAEAEWRRMKMKVDGPRKKENCYIVISMVLILLFYLISVVPVSIDILLNSTVDMFISDIFMCLTQWSFVASVAWNPWIYNFRSRLFRKDMASAWQTVSKLITQYVPQLRKKQ